MLRRVTFRGPQVQLGQFLRTAEGLIIRHKFSIPIHVRYVPRAAVEHPRVMKVRKECFLGFDAIRSYQGLSLG